MTKAVSRRANRRRGDLPGRVLVAVDDQGRALLCPYAPDAQGGHPEGDDLYCGPFEELGAVAAGPLSILALLDADRAVVLEAVWLDHDAATVAALLAGETLPGAPDLDPVKVGEDAEDDQAQVYTEALLAQAEAAQARADGFRALAAAAQIEDPPPPEPPPPTEP